MMNESNDDKLFLKDVIDTFFVVVKYFFIYCKLIFENSKKNVQVQIKGCRYSVELSDIKNFNESYFNYFNWTILCNNQLLEFD